MDFTLLRRRLQEIPLTIHLTIGQISLFFFQTFLHSFFAGYLTALINKTALPGKFNGPRSGLFIVELFSALGDRIK